MKIKIKNVDRISYIWIYSSIMIFLFGFLKIYFAVPVALATGFALYKTFKVEKLSAFFISRKTLIAGGLVVLFWMVMCGQGGFVNQMADWHGRNAQLQDLINYSWPVYYKNGSAFTYYIGHFVVPALFGKMFGLGAGRACLMIYTSIGVYLIWIYLIKILKAETSVKQIGVLLLLMFFGNMEDLHRIVADFVAGIFHVNTSAVVYGFTPNDRAFAGVFNQVTCAFLVLCMFFEDDTKIENFMVMGVPMLFFSPFMLISVFVLFAVRTIVILLSDYKRDIVGFTKRLFSIQNICVLLFLLPILIMYLSGNVFADKPQELGLQFVSYRGRIIGYLIFVVFEFLLYSICIYPKYKENVYFYTANVILIGILFFRMGVYNDFVTRNSSVGLFVIMILVGEFLLDKGERLLTRKIILCTLIVVTAIPFANEYISKVKGIAESVAAGNYESRWSDNWKTYEGLPDRYDASDLKYGYYTFDAKEHFFFKYMARK